MRSRAISLAAFVSLVSACGARTGLDAPANDDGGGDGGGGGSPGTCGSCFQSDLDGTCTTTLTAAPFQANSDGSFQSIPGTGYQTTIEISFSQPVDHFGVRVLDPDFSENYVEALDANGNSLAKVSVPFDGVPNQLTSEDISIDFPGIVTIRLVPDPLDYVWYESPWACADGL